MKSSFTSCGTITFTQTDLQKEPGHFTELVSSSSLYTATNIKLSVETFNLRTTASGFLTIGKPDMDSNFVYWDRKWCVLEGRDLYIYNYPQEKEMDKTPESSIDLYSSVSPFSNIRKCPRRKSFILKMKDSDSKNNFLSLRHPDGTGLKTYLLAADNHQDVQIWTAKITYVVDFLTKWNSFLCIE